MNRGSNYQDLIKVVAMVAMVIDHLGLYLFPDQLWMRIIGRTVMPVFCFFAGYNFHGKPKTPILTYGFLLCAMSYTMFWEFQTANILISIYLGQCYLYIFKNSLKKPLFSYFHIIVTSLLYLATRDLFDYGTLSIAIMIIGHATRLNMVSVNLAALCAVTLSVFHTTLNFEDANVYLVILIAILEYLFIIFKDLASPIDLNVKWLSRNSLFIYFAHLTLIEIIFFFILVYRYGF